MTTYAQPSDVAVRWGQDIDGLEETTVALVAGQP